ncbi:hypothetical protein SAMN05216480_1034 [Pustulibacterium marinum]|uniref:Uncharacterized protein n=1 Tax=Pustulibacterium marinum TaxID=1224947 RepID=A0A1I7FZT8_9FLAO|nr:hypothetical protein [Pustulibacterium marinum]SFU41710.1 hypothetical protein SAMN05216480_1034 [Pustulibacterium marinum]
MNTKIIMTSSALFLAAIGISLSFLPNELASYLETEVTSVTVLCLQLLSTLYMGFGLVNWMAKGSIIGGIYNRPIVMGNLMHFGVGAVVLFKMTIRSEAPSTFIIVLTAVYGIFAMLFLYLFRNNPAKVAA